MRSTRKAWVAGAVGIALAALSACTSATTGSSDSGAASGQPAGTGSASSAPAAQGAGGDISLWHIQTTGDGPKLISDAVDRYTAANPNVKVEISPIANDAFKDKLKVAIGAGDAPCIFPTWGGGPLANYAKAGEVLDLTPYVTKDGYQDRFVPASWDNVTFDGKVYGVPVENSAAAVMWYSKPVFEKYGLTPPKTWAEFMTVINTLKDNGVAPIALANKPKWPGIMWYDYLVDRIGGSDVFKNAALRTGGTFQDPAFVEAAKKLQELVDMGAFQKGFNGTDYDTGGARQLLYSGKAAMQLMGGWEYGNFVSDGKADDFGFFPFPAVDGGVGDPSDLLGTIGDNFYSISASCENPDAAFEVIKYMIDDTSVAARVAAGRIPPVVGVKLTDPNSAALSDLMQKAAGVQLWWDQYMPAEFAQLHLNEVQSLLGKSTTPDEFAKAHEDLATSLLGASQ